MTAQADCVLWTGTVNNAGYGVAHVGDSTTSAHRALWILLHGPLPAGLEIDHLCGNRLCVNVDHLEPVTHAENMRRSSWTQRTHCPRGHVLEGDNLYVQTLRTGHVVRSCRICRKERSHRAAYGNDPS